MIAFVPGCIDAQSNVPDDSSSPASNDAVEPVVVTQDFFAATSGGAGSVAVNLPFDASKVQVVVDFGTSAFTGFTFQGLPACGQGFGPGSGAYPQSSQWSGDCGSASAGHYDLAWAFSGEAQGKITVTALP
jgi:hypothetical protein